MSSTEPRPAAADQPSARTQRTAAVLERLRSRRRARFRQRTGDIAYGAYLAIFGGSLVVVPLVTAVRQTLRVDVALPQWAPDLADSLPFCATAALLVMLWSVVYDATVRGAVRLEPAAIDWVLTLPINQSAVLRPALWRMAAIRTVIGAALGLALLVGLWQFAVPAPEEGAVAALARAAVGGALTGVLTAALGAAATVVGERPLQILRPVYYVVLFLLIAAGTQAWATRVPPLAESFVLWSGPWGWAAQPFLPQAVSGAAAPWSALLLLAAVAAGTLAWALRILPEAPLERLRAHAAAAQGVRSGFWLIDANWLHRTFAAAHTASHYQIRLPPPRWAWLTVPWRDTLNALRSPISLLRAALLATIAALVANLPIEPVSTVALALTAAIPALHYFAASQLLGAARAEVTDPRLARYFPHTPGVLGLTHGLVPTVALAAMTALSGTAAAAVSGADARLVVHTVLLVPAAVAAALVSLYRGTLPAYLAVGYDTPFGNSAPLQMLLWHAAGLAGLVAFTWPAVSGALTGPWTVAVWLLVTAGGLTVWAHHRARRALDVPL